MTRKKKKAKEEQKPWCFYCDREFQDEATLVQHQKNKHFKCPECNRKLNTARGLEVHAYQVHHITVTAYVCPWQQLPLQHSSSCGTSTVSPTTHICLLLQCAWCQAREGEHGAGDIWHCRAARRVAAG
jgi:DNA-directed RNA polymerase subunit RPC12/RpoP